MPMSSHLIASLVISLLSPLCCIGIPNSLQTSPKDAMLKELSEVEGEYVRNDSMKQYVFSNKLRLEEIISTREPKTIIPVLVACLDNLSQSRVTLNGNRVAIGVVCYETLSQIVYYEPTTRRGDIARTWSGHISPKATPRQLRNAKRAWMKVVKDKSYSLL